MAKLWKSLFAGMLVTAAILSLPPKADASSWCTLCEEQTEWSENTCYYCCRCDGGGGAACSNLCLN